MSNGKSKRIIGILCAAVLAASASAGAIAQGEAPYKVFTARGTLNVKNTDGTFRKIQFDRYQAPDDVGEAIAGAGDEGVQCEDRELDHAEARAPEVTIEVPKFKLQHGSAFCRVVSKVKKEGTLFELDFKVRSTGVKG